VNGQDNTVCGVHSTERWIVHDTGPAARNQRRLSAGTRCGTRGLRGARAAEVAVGTDIATSNDQMLQSGLIPIKADVQALSRRGLVDRVITVTVVRS
jgi:hypothetical protein